MNINEIYGLVFEEESNTPELTEVPSQHCVDFVVELVQLLKDLDIRKVNPQLLAFYKLVAKNIQPVLDGHFGEKSPWILKLVDGKYLAQYSEEKAEKLGIVKDEPKEEAPQAEPVETEKVEEPEANTK